MSSWFKITKIYKEKEYSVTLKNNVKYSDAKTFKGPMYLDEKLLKPALIKNINNNKRDFVISEDKFHKVKHMFHKINNEVIELHRTRIHDIKLGDFNLEIGEYIECYSKQ